MRTEVVTSSQSSSSGADCHVADHVQAKSRIITGDIETVWASCKAPEARHRADVDRVRQVACPGAEGLSSDDSRPIPGPHVVRQAPQRAGSDGSVRFWNVSTFKIHIQPYALMSGSVQQDWRLYAPGEPQPSVH